MSVDSTRPVVANQEGKMTLSFLAPLIFVGGGVVILDQITKLLVVHYMPLFDTKVILPGFFNLVHVHNTGGAFSLLAGENALWRRVFFVLVTLFVLALLLYVYGKVDRRDRWTRNAYALICGGAVGNNLIDRLRLGEVIDFLDVYVGSLHWPAFNVADSAISIGAVMLLISLIKNK